MKNEGIKKLLSKTFEGPEGNGSWFTELLGALGHAAYHLGAIRQMVKFIK